MRDRVTFRSSDGTISADDRSFPVVVCTLEGELDPRLVDDLFDWIDRLVREASARGARYVMVFDAATVHRPSPAVRGRISKRVDALPPVWLELNISALMIIENPLVRGALTALSWITRAKLSVTYVASIPAAFAHARKDLARAGIQAPDSLDGYQRPSSRDTR